MSPHKVSPKSVYLAAGAGAPAFLRKSVNSRNTESLDHAKSKDINIYGEATSELSVGLIESKDIKQYYKINEVVARGDENAKASDSLSKDINQYYKKQIDSNKQNARVNSKCKCRYKFTLPVREESWLSLERKEETKLYAERRRRQVATKSRL
ncbi:hypothetical protein Tco_0645495 [Tanacetum coccineum]